MNHRWVGGAPPMICLDIGGSSIGGAVVTLGESPEVHLRRSVPTGAQDGGRAVLDRAVSVARELQAEVPEVCGVGVASAGVIDPETGAVASATDLMPGWAGTALGAVLSEGLGLPLTTVLNDVHAHALGESRHGAGQGADSALVAAVGTGLGGAFIGTAGLVRGSGGLAGHIGHVQHAEAAGILCTCGRTGHLESITSGSGIEARYTARRGRDDPPAEDGAAVSRLAAEGVGLASATLRTAGTALGEALGSLSNAWDPEVIVLTGSVTGAGETWWSALRAGYASTAMDPLRGRTLTRGTLGADAPLLGAASAWQDAPAGQDLRSG